MGVLMSLVGAVRIGTMPIEFATAMKIAKVPSSGRKVSVFRTDMTLEIIPVMVSPIISSAVGENLEISSADTMMSAITAHVEITVLLMGIPNM